MQILSPSPSFLSSKIDNVLSRKTSVIANKSSLKAVPLISASLKPDTPLLPIILGEEHVTATPSFLILENVDKLQNNNIQALAIEENKFEEEYQNFNADFSKERLSFLREQIKEVVDDPKFSDDECDKSLLWFSDKYVKKFFKMQGMYKEEKVVFEEVAHSYPHITRFGKEIKVLSDKIMPCLSKDKMKIRRLYSYDYLGALLPSDILIPSLLNKGFEYHSIDTGKIYAEIMTGDATNNDALILRDQGMIENIQRLNQTIGVIAIMGLAHMIALKAHYPDIAVYKNATNMKDFSLEEIRHRDGLDSRYIKNIESKTYFDDAFQSRNPDAPLVEPSDEVLEVLYRLTKEKKL